MSESRACNKTCPHNADNACAWGAVIDIAACPHRVAPAPVDAVSGLTPRFTPKTPLPPGAVLFLLRGEDVDCYWLPSGAMRQVVNNGNVSEWASIWATDLVAAARALLAAAQEQP